MASAAAATVRHTLLSPDLLLLITTYQRGIYIDMLPLAPLRAVPQALFRPTVLNTKMQRTHAVVDPWLQHHGLARLATLLSCLPHMHLVLTQHAVYVCDLFLASALHELVDLAAAVSDPLWDLAALQNHLPMLHFLHDVVGHTGYSFNAVQWACEGGHLDVLAFLHAHLPNEDDEWTPAAMDAAAAHGHVHVVAFLHTHRTEGCTTNAMDKAAAHGHLDVVCYLHQHRTEGCTVAAMNLALSYDHMHVVRWLHANRTEGCTAQAMNLAARDGNVDLVTWLHHHRPEGCTQEAMDEAAAEGHLDVVTYLHQHNLAKCSRVALSRAVQHGHAATASFLRAHGALHEPREFTPRYHI
ncbi:Aste57867_1840 [Aphanomyces stellatus]|uniref:Aste57867_1840 protein n=1 Tax=Aphanomyces stellatus TaxID=120398 RepID=A0A485K768_9STRA|nr:hypothetical protein As57867_001838 [Aphanomyces stellatus]VFT79048.1 Aste57867_1840 [Aphanomyces stellatus]